MLLPLQAINCSRDAHWLWRGSVFEPSRLCRRAQLPRKWSRYEQDNE